MLVVKAKIRSKLRIYAIGDVHGCIHELLNLLQLIDRDLVINPVQKHKLVFLGDYIDRGPGNRDVIAKLHLLEKSERKTVFLRGNHDQKLLDFLKNPEKAGEGFLRWGGRETLRSYGIETGIAASYTKLSAELVSVMPSTHVEFLKRLQYLHVEDDYVFVHAGIRPKVKLEKQDVDDLMRIRNDFLRHAGEFPKVVVHGHTPVSEPEIRNNRINIDTRCYETGCLTALVLEGKTRRFLQTAKS